MKVSNNMPRLYLIYAILPEQLQYSNGTALRLTSLRKCFSVSYEIIEINLLSVRPTLKQKILSKILIFLGLNNLRYLPLVSRIPNLSRSDKVLFSGIYCSSLALLFRHIQCSVDLVDSLTRTDWRGIQSFWYLRPIYHLIQFPISFLLEKLVLNSPCINTIFLTTEKEVIWLDYFHGQSKKVAILPNLLPSPAALSYTSTDFDGKLLLASKPGCVDVAVLASLDWWVNRKMFVECVSILSLYQSTRPNAPCFKLHLYGTPDSCKHLARVIVNPRIILLNFGIIDSLNIISITCRFALLPNLIGRGFQNKLFSMLGTSIPLIVDESMMPYENNSQRAVPPSLFICSSKDQYLSSIDMVLSLPISARCSYHNATNLYFNNLTNETLESFCFARSII